MQVPDNRVTVNELLRDDIVGHILGIPSFRLLPDIVTVPFLEGTVYDLRHCRHLTSVPFSVCRDV